MKLNFLRMNPMATMMQIQCNGLKPLNVKMSRLKPFEIHRRPQDDTSEDEDDGKSQSTECGSTLSLDEAPFEDPFEGVICREGMGRFVILFHGDTFSVPPR